MNTLLMKPARACAGLALAGCASLQLRQAQTSTRPQAR